MIPPPLSRRSRRSLFRFFECIGTMNPTVGRNLFGVPPSGGPDRLKPGHQTVGSRKAPTTLMPCIGTMNLPGKSTAPRRRRTPKHGGGSSDCGQRTNLLECSGAPPLSMGACTGNSCGLICSILSRRDGVLRDGLIEKSVFHNRFLRHWFSSQDGFHGVERGRAKQRIAFHRTV